MSLSNEIKTIRQKSFMTQTEFAEALNVNFSTINRWEKGKTRPNATAIKKLIGFCSEKSIDFNGLESAWVQSKVEE